MGTSGVFAVDPVVAAVLTGDINEIRRQSPPVLARARQEVAAAKLAGTLSSSRPSRFEACPSCHSHFPEDHIIEQLTISLTERCNLRCRYCPMTHEGLDWQRHHSNESITWSVLDKALQYYFARCDGAPSPSISFYGGEPLLAFELLERACGLIREHKSADEVRIIIDTNGLLLEREEVINLVATHDVHLQVSLDGPPEIHDRHRVLAGGGPSHKKIMTGLKALVDRVPEALGRLRFQVTVVDPADLIEVADWFAALPWFNPGKTLSPTLGVNMADLSGAPEELRKIPSFVDGTRDQLWRRHLSALTRGEAGDPVSKALFEPALINFYHRARAVSGSSVSPSGFCRAGERRLHVTTDGTFQPCERVGSSLAIGNVDQGLDESRAQSLTRVFCETMKERCLGCWAQRLCMVCATALAPTDGVEGLIPMSVCDSVRSQGEDTFRLWLDLVGAEGDAAEFLRRSVVR